MSIRRTYGVILVAIGRRETNPLSSEREQNTACTAGAEQIGSNLEAAEALKSYGVEIAEGDDG